MADDFHCAEMRQNRTPTYFAPTTTKYSIDEILLFQQLIAGAIRFLNHNISGNVMVLAVPITINGSATS